MPPIREVRFVERLTAGSLAMETERIVAGLPATYRNLVAAGRCSRICPVGTNYYLYG